MEPVQDLDHSGFEDYSLSTEMERLTFAIEQAAERWFRALATSGQRLSGLAHITSRGVTTAVEGAKPCDSIQTCSLFILR